jgi:parallel beta-helix repeat protein
MKYALLFVLIVQYMVLGDTYYVGGSDGTGTIQAAVDKAGAGDTVLVRNGTYHEKVEITSSGTESSYLVIMAAPGEKPVIDGKYELPGTGKYDGLVEIRAQYLEFNGFTVKNSSGRGLKVLPGASHVRLLNNDCNYNWNSGLNSQTAEHLLIENNKVWQNARHNAGENRNMKTGWPGCFMLEDSKHCTVTGNEIYQNHGEGFIYLRSTDGVIEDNICWDNLAVNLYLDNAARCLVQRNIVYNTDDREFWRWAEKGWPTHGIFIANEVYAVGKYGRPPHEQCKDLVIINNIVFDTRFGVAFWTEDNIENSALVRVLIANNTFYDIFDDGLQINRPTANHDARIYNNIIHCMNDMIVCHTWAGIDFKNNCWSNTPPSQASSGADVIGGPQISAQGSLEGGELAGKYFMLKNGSPCIGKAVTVSDVPQDFFSRTRDKNPDIGAHEYQHSTSTHPATLFSSAQTAVGYSQGRFLLNGRFIPGQELYGKNACASSVFIQRASKTIIHIIR